MGTRATGTVTSKAWEQTPYAEIEGASQPAAATGEDRYDGDIEGDASWRGLMISGPDGSGTFRSVQRMDCVLAGRRGSFVLEMSGTFDATGGSRADREVVPGTGTGDLTGISGAGGYEAAADRATYTLDYSFD